MTNDCESALRAMLQERASDIDAVPAHLLPRRPAASAHHRPSRYWLVAAASVAVLAVTGGALAVGRVTTGDHSAPAGPVTHLPTAVPSPTTRPSDAPTPTSSRQPARAVQACAAVLPHGWKVALDAPPSAFGAQSAYPMSITANGDLLVARDFGHGGKRDLLLIAPGKAPREVFRVADPDKFGIYSADLHGHQLIVSVGSDPRPAKGVQPGGSPHNLVRSYVIDLRTGARTRLFTTSGAEHVAFAPVLLDGKVYWIVLPRYASHTGKIESYDLATGTTRTVYSGAGFPTAYRSAAGFEVGGKLVVAASLPTAVASALTPKNRMHVQTDGFSYAWVAGPRQIGWWSPGRAAPTYITLRTALPTNEYSDLLAVAGHYVVVDGHQVLDMATGAIASVGATKFGKSIVLARNDVLAVVDYVGTGHWEDGYWVDPLPRLVRVSTDSLPDLRC